MIIPAVMDSGPRPIGYLDRDVFPILHKGAKMKKLVLDTDSLRVGSFEANSPAKDCLTQKKQKRFSSVASVPSA